MELIHRIAAAYQRLAARIDNWRDLIAAQPDDPDRWWR